MSYQADPTAVLFSGGRDSSLVTCLLASRGTPVHLLTCNNGVSIGTDLSEYRLLELRNAFAGRILGRTVASTMGLFRRVALADLERDFARFQKNLIVLGSQIAIHTEAIAFSLAHGIRTVASGFTSYQSHFAEQKTEAISAFQSLFSEYGIQYVTPIYDYATCDEVKYQLLDFGVSTKSLESVSIFSDTFSEPSAEQVLEYLESKLGICRDYIALKAAHNPGRQGSQ